VAWQPGAAAGWQCHVRHSVGPETVRTDAPGEFTQWPTGYPDFPVPQRLRVDDANERRLAALAEAAA